MKHFSLLIFLFSFVLASCSKTDEALTAPESGEQLATFSIEAPATRATVSGLSRYIVEAYENDELNTKPTRVEAETGSLTLILRKNTQYTFVFWADKGTAKSENVASSGYYNTDDLREVAVTVGKESIVGEVAYCFAVSFNSKDFESKKTVTLKNATSQINFVEAASLTASDNTLTVKYLKGAKLNVATGIITEVDSEITHTFTGIEQATKDVKLATDYILAPLTEKRIVDLKVTLNSEVEKSITSVPFQQSYKTNIKGEYSNLFSGTFTITADDDWVTPDNEVVFPKP